jgi:aspartate racemase
MKKIGLVGGTSWSSTIDYYRFINEGINEKLGGLNFAECIIYSVNFADFRTLNAKHNWDGAFELLAGAALKLKAAGAEVILLGANTAHIVADRVKEHVQLPLIDIRVATAEAIISRGLQKVGLLGTCFTMELDFYRDKLAEKGIETIIPQSRKDLLLIEHTLVHELGKGILSPTTKQAYLHIIDKLIAEGAEGIILGCTEIPLLIAQDDVPVPVFNSTQIHSQAAVDFALASKQSAHYEY